MKVSNFDKWEQRLWKEDGFISFLFGWALVTIVFLVVLLFQLLSFSTPSDIKQLKGRGTVRTYDFSYDRVFYTSVRVINERGLSIVESNKEEGYIIASSGSGFFYDGRIIALFFTSGSSKNHTQVEVLSRFMALPPLKELVLPRNPPSQILNDIGKRLENDKEEE
jgi:hypothetical protein